MEKRQGIVFNKYNKYKTYKYKTIKLININY